MAAEGLVEAGAGAVVNAAPSISGRYPNVGPLLLAAAGIPLVDGVGRRGDGPIVRGRRVTIRSTASDVRRRRRSGGHRRRARRIESLEDAVEARQATMGDELERFAENTLEYLRRERHLLIDAPDVPDVGVDFAGPPRADRRAGHRLPGGPRRSCAAPATSARCGRCSSASTAAPTPCSRSGHKPDVIIGDFDSVSERRAALRRRAGRARLPRRARRPGAERLDELGLDYVVFEAAGTSEDIAMLLAYEKGAELIVAVGTHTSMVEFLDKGRGGHGVDVPRPLKVGPILVDAKGVSRLYQTTVRTRDLFLLVLAAICHHGS